MDDTRRSAVLSNSTSVISLTAEKQTGDNYDNRLAQKIHHLKEENEQLSHELLGYRQKNLDFEESKVKMTTAFNKENAENLTRIAKLESQLEKGEATRQTLEFDLAVLRKKTNDMVHTTTQRENSLTDEKKILASKSSELEVKVEDLEKALQIARRVTMEDERRIAFLVDEKKQIESDKLASEAVLRSQHDKLVEEKSAVSAQTTELRKKIKSLEQSLVKQEEELRQRVTDLQIVSEREQHLRAELNELGHRSRALEESVEAERAAHLESKFNAEIIQLKHQETETALATEKELSVRLGKDLDFALERTNELNNELLRAKEEAADSSQKLEKNKQVNSEMKSQLEQDLSEKSKQISELSTQITKQQENFDNLKEELNNTRKRQIYLEEIYSGNMREVEMLLATYCSEPLTKPTAQKKSEKTKPLTPDPKLVLDNLKRCLVDMKKNIADLQRDIGASKSAEALIQKDCNNFRDRAIAREKDLQQAQQEMINCRMELDMIRMQQAEYERESSRLQRDLEEVTAELEAQRYRCKQLEENAAGLTDRHKTEMEAHLSFLRELHHALGPHARVLNSFSNFTWSELSLGVREGVDTVTSLTARLKEKAAQHESSSIKLERTLQELQHEHELSVDRLAKQLREREEEGKKQRMQLEEHYNALLSEMHSRAQKSQGLCDEAWERIRAGDGVSDALHAECSQLRGQNSNLVQERNALSCACALLFGSLYPVLRARDDLARQRSLLMRINEDSHMFKNQLRILVETISEELSKPGDKSSRPVPSSFKKIHPLIRFRVAAITVLAANRLRTLALASNVTMFTCNESSASANRVLVVAGKSSSMPKQDDAPLESHSDSATQWLCDQRVNHMVRDTMCGLVDALDKNTGNRKGYMSRAVVKTAKNAFLNLLRSTHPMFSSLVVTSSNVVRERSSLIYMLSEGLERLVHKEKLTDVIKLFSVEHSLSNLQRHLLHFTERLHSTEVEKRNLKNSEKQLKMQIQHLNQNKSDLDLANDEIKLLRERESHLVSRKRFDGVCAELNSALEREQQAQKLLHEQNAKLQELSVKLDEQCTEGAEKENTLSHAVNSLSDVKMELRRCAQNKRILSKQVQKLEQEKDNLGNKVSDAREALKKAAREKDSLASYFLSIEKILKKTPEDTSQLVKTKLPGDLSEEKAGPDIIAAQRAVQSFVVAQSSAVSRISSLEDQIASYRSHIGALKRELHDACKRENGYGPSLSHEISHIPTKDHSSQPLNGKDYPVSCSTPSDADFKPLKGVVVNDSNFSLPPATLMKL